MPLKTFGGRYPAIPAVCTAEPKVLTFVAGESGKATALDRYLARPGPGRTRTAARLRKRLVPRCHTRTLCRSVGQAN